MLSVINSHWVLWPKYSFCLCIQKLFCHILQCCGSLLLQCSALPTGAWHNSYIPLSHPSRVELRGYHVTCVPFMFIYYMIFKMYVLNIVRAMVSTLAMCKASFQDHIPLLNRTPFCTVNYSTPPQEDKVTVVWTSGFWNMRKQLTIEISVLLHLKSHHHPAHGEDVSRWCWKVHWIVPAFTGWTKAFLCTKNASLYATLLIKDRYEYGLATTHYFMAGSSYQKVLQKNSLSHNKSFYLGKIKKKKITTLWTNPRCGLVLFSYSGFYPLQLPYWEKKNQNICTVSLLRGAA